MKWVARRNFYLLPVFCRNARYFCKRVNANISNERFFANVTEFIYHWLVVEVGNKINWNNTKDLIHLPKMSSVYASSQSNQLLGVILSNLFELDSRYWYTIPVNFGVKFYYFRTACATEQIGIVKQQMAGTKLLIWTVLFGIYVVFLIGMLILPSDPCFTQIRMTKFICGKDLLSSRSMFKGTKKTHRLIHRNM